jgi:hypothetical protein
MMIKFYMTKTMDFAASCQDNTPPPDQSFLPIPDEMLDKGEGYGTRWDGSRWVDDPESYARVEAVLCGTQSWFIEEQRASMTCTRWQLIVALGESKWAKILAFRDDPDCTWAMRQIIDTAVTIPRVSELVDFLAYVLGLDAAAADALFTSAMSLRA